MSAPQKEYERYIDLMDREACDDPLNATEREFCRTFEERHPELCPELQLYTELSRLSPPPDASSKALVDRALARLESEDGARESAEARLLRRTYATAWPTLIGVAAFALGATYALLERSPQARGTNNLTGSHAPAPLVRAELVYASGRVTVSGVPASAGRALLAQNSVVETTDGGACILIDSDINICLGPESRMRLTSVAGPARSIELEGGKLAARLSIQPEGSSLSIVADGIASTAIGTAFSVERTDEHSVITTVLNGKVRVGLLGADESTIVNAHERAVIARTAAKTPNVTSVRRTEEAPSWVLLGPTVLWHDPVAATLEVRGTPAGADAWLDDQWLGSTPVSSLIPVGEHRVVIRKDHQELLAEELHVHAGDTKEVRYDPFLQQTLQAGMRQEDEHEDRSGRVLRRPAGLPGAAPAATRTREPAAASPAATPAASPNGPEAAAASEGAELMRQARQAVRVGQFPVAAGLYEKLIESNSDSNEAHTALVLLGQLRLNQLNDPSGALKPLELYLASGGAIEAEARVARIDALHALKRPHDEAAAIEEFLVHHPRSFDIKRMHARLDELRALK